VVHRINQHGNPQGVGKQYELLPLAAADLACARQKIDGKPAFVERQPDIGHEVVQVMHPAIHDRLQPGIRRVRETIAQCIADVVFIKILHSNGLRTGQLRVLWTPSVEGIVE
jgi:hypothetical protein